MDKKITGIVAYLTWIGWLIAFVAGDREGAKFHLNQALVLLLISLIASLLSKIPVVGFILNAAAIILWLIGLIGAIKGEEKPLPYIGNIQLLK